MDLKQLLPWPLMDRTFLDVTLRQWTAVLLFAVAAWIAAWLLVVLVRKAARSLVKRTDTSLDDRILKATIAPLRYLALALLLSAALTAAEVEDPLHSGLMLCVRALALASVAIILVRLVDLAAALVRARMESSGRRDLLSILPITWTFAKVAVFLVALIFLLQNLGVNVTGLVAGVGIGGLALALAAQQTVENLFGGLTIIADRPVRVGDTCKFGDRIGTVEEIGLRSSRIRTPERTLVSVPNADFAGKELENLTLRDRILFKTALGLRYETSPDQIRWLLVEIRNLLHSHPMVLEEGARVRFIQMGAYSLDLEVFCYVNTSEWPRFLEVKEDLLLSLMDLVAASGSDFAFPSQTAYMSRDPGVNDELGRKAEETISLMRDKDELPLPEFPR